MSTLTTPRRKPAAVRTKKLRIIYADDMDELRHVVKIILTRDGHAIECVASAESLLALLRANPDACDLVITDHHMPHMDGLELVHRLREMNFPGRIMIFSSELSAEVDAAYHALHVDHILSKPVYPAVIRQAIASLFTPAPAL